MYRSPVLPRERGNCYSLEKEKKTIASSVAQCFQVLFQYFCMLKTAPSKLFRTQIVYSCAVIFLGNYVFGNCFVSIDEV